MKDKIKFDLTDAEKSIITKSLNMLRNYLSAQERSTDSVDEILVKINSRKVELDTFDSKIVINALNNTRYKLKSNNQPRGEVNDILLKMIDETDKKKALILRKHTRDNGRKF